jgi:hypothetical protein
MKAFSRGWKKARQADHRGFLGALFLMGSGQYCAVPAILVWLTGNSAGHYKRATVSALQLAIANCGKLFSVLFNVSS